MKKLLGFALLATLSVGVRAADEKTPPPPKEERRVVVVEKEDKSMKEEIKEGGNKFTRFFTHTIGKPLKKGFKHTGKKIEEGFN